MMRVRALLSLFSVLLGSAEAQDKNPITVQRVLVKPAELPRNVKFAEGMPCASRQARSYFEDPECKSFFRRKNLPKPLQELQKILPIPARKQSQSFVAAGGVAGSVLLFEFGPGETARAVSFLRSYLWGGPRHSEKHPEELIVHGRLVWVLSFPRGDRAAEWYKQRLRKKLRVPVPRAHPEHDALGRKLAAAYSADDAAAGIRLMGEHPAAVKNWAFGQYLLGEFGLMAEKWKLAGKGYRRALELHESLVDPLEYQLVWPALDGLGSALLMQRKLGPAVAALRRAREFAASGGISGGSQSSYNLACALSLLQRWPEAHRALKEAIAQRPEYREDARTDPDLADARKRKEFSELLR